MGSKQKQAANDVRSLSTECFDLRLAADQQPDNLKSGGDDSPDFAKSTARWYVELRGDLPFATSPCERLYASMSIIPVARWQFNSPRLPFISVLN
jgi:hypothetical protein